MHDFLLFECFVAMKRDDVAYQKHTRLLPHPSHSTPYTTLPFPQAGTPYYTAPEMIQREPYSYPADCWSFGVIVHQLLALERPFDGASTGDLVKSILSGEIPALPVHYSDDIK